MVETALFSIYRRPSPAPAPSADAAPEPSAAPAPVPAEALRPEPPPAPAPVPAPEPDDPAPRNDSVLTALGIVPHDAPDDITPPPAPETQKTQDIAAMFDALALTEAEEDSPAPAGQDQPAEFETSPHDAPAPLDATLHHDEMPASAPEAPLGTASPVPFTDVPDAPHALLLHDEVPAWEHEPPRDTPPLHDAAFAEPHDVPHAFTFHDDVPAPEPAALFSVHPDVSSAFAAHDEVPVPQPLLQLEPLPFDDQPDVLASYDDVPALDPLLPPKPIFDDRSAFAPLDESLAPETPSLPDSDAPYAEGVPHQLLGLANPIVFTVRATVAESDPVDLTTGRAGIYRPVDVHLAPWGGFAYDTVEDSRTGLAAGTRLLTARGEVPVEELTPGDVALGLRGPTLLPIRWIGHSRADTAPIRIEADALGPNRPRRAICVATDHPVYVDQSPIPTPARALVNGITIYTADTGETELFHIDVGAAEVLFADGLPVASTQRSLVPA